MEYNVKELINEINTTRTQTSANAKDETRVMKAMLNDPSFKVDIWGRNGIEGQYCPYDESRTLVANIIKDATKITSKEAQDLASQYEFGRQEANIMINLSKEFINTYILTGRKINLGGRVDSNISIARKVKESRTNSFPKKVGVNEDGTDRYETVTQGNIPTHGSLKVYSSAPSWLFK
jgi:hypothetical protein